MPSSFASSFAPIVNAIVDLAPRRVIDVGPGYSKYGLACREYLPGLEQLWAVEVPQGRMVIQDAVYDIVLEADVRSYTAVGDPWANFDLALFIDVVEHMTVAQGQAVLRAVGLSGCRAIVATPRIFIPQHGGDNPFETHVALWTPDDFNPVARHRRNRSTDDAFIFVLEP